MTPAHIQWTSDDEIAFVAGGKNGRSQLVAVQISTGKTEELTALDTDVVSFGMSGDTFLVYARAAPSKQRFTYGGAYSIYDLMKDIKPKLALLELFRGSRATRQVARIPLPPMAVGHDGIWVSRDGSRALVSVPIVNAPSHWAEYRVYSNELFGFGVQTRDDDPRSWNLAQRTRYALIDLRTGAVRNLMDAPDGRLSFTATPMRVFWPRDRRTVVVSHVYLPLRVSDADRVRRAQGPSIAEVDLESGAVLLGGGRWLLQHRTRLLLHGSWPLGRFP